MPQTRAGKQTGQIQSETQKARQSSKPAPDSALAGPTVQRALQQPSGLNTADALTLQRSIGNRGANRLLAGRNSERKQSSNSSKFNTGGFAIQTKLHVGPVGDAYEQEADRVATQVVNRMAASGGDAPSDPTDGIGAGPTVQRHPNHRDEELQAKPIAAGISPFIQRHAWIAEEEEVQAKPIEGRLQRHAGHEDETLQASGEAGGFDAPRSVEGQLASQRGGGQALPDTVRRSMEGGFGADFGGVRLHTDAQSAQLNQQLHAQAFTHGSDIYFGAGRFNPGTSSGSHLLAHELTHVVQQTGPAVKRKANGEGQGAAIKINQRMRGSEGAQRLSRFSLKGGAKWLGKKMRRIGDMFNLGTKGRHQSLSEKYGTAIGPEAAGGNKFSHGMLDRLDEVLGQLPRAHTKGNDKIERIQDAAEDPNSAIGGASGYNYEKNKLDIVRPMKMPRWFYSWLGKGVVRPLMDWVAMKPFYQKKANTGEAARLSNREDKSLGLGSRSLMGNGPLNKGSVYKWTIRHELGHAVDNKIKFTNKRARLPDFGGWKQYGDDKTDELARAFLSKGGIGEDVYGPTFDREETVQEVDQEATDIEVAKWEARKQEGKRVGSKPRKFKTVTRTKSISLLEMFTNLVSRGTGLDVHDAEDMLFEQLNTAMTGMDPTEKQTWMAANTPKLRKAIEAFRIAQLVPFTLPGGGPSVINGRIYQVDQYGKWVSYLKQARAFEMSNYQFSSPAEWFAEAYAAFYDPQPGGPSAKLNQPTRDFFQTHLGPPQPDGKPPEARPSLVNEEGNLQELGDIEEMDKAQDIAEEISQTLKMARPDYAGGDSEDQPRQPVKAEDQIVPVKSLKPGDIMMMQGTNPVAVGQGVATVLRTIFKGATGVGLYHAVKDAARMKHVNTVHAAVYIGGKSIAHATNAGVIQGGISGKYLVFRNKDGALARRAAEVARKWAPVGNGSIGYSAGKAVFGGGLGPSNFSSKRAAVLATYAQQDIMPSDMFCSEFAISVFQAAALLPAIEELKGELPAGGTKKENKKWAEKNAKQFENVKANTLNLDPRNTSPQRLIAKLYQLTGGQDPSWSLIGNYQDD